MACMSVSPHKQVGMSVYKVDYKPRISTGRYNQRPANRLRRNRPHPHQDFLLPYRIDDSIELQKRVRKAVREYLGEIYAGQDSRSSSLPPPQFHLPTNDDDLKPKEILAPKVSDNYYCDSFPRDTYKEQLGVSGQGYFERSRPATAVALEKAPPSRLQGETKRDRSIRIRQEIEQKNRVPTPSPQPKKWQRIRSAAPPRPKPAHSKPTQGNRVSSAPPATVGYSYYKQSTKAETKGDMYKPMQERLKVWADTANDYEKQAVYDLLTQAAQPKTGPPATPPSPQEAYHLLLRAKSVPTQHITSVDEEKNEKRSSWSPYFNDLRRQQTKQRNLNSAPIKPMLGLVPKATQYPHRDQRAFRLKGQDQRVQGNPTEERELKEYLSKVARISQKHWKQPENKSLISPMHSYPSDRKGAAAKDYKCDVSFFQSVRAPFKSHFVIHPDFSSENFIQKKHADQMVSHIRY